MDVKRAADLYAHCRLARTLRSPRQARSGSTVRPAPAATMINTSDCPGTSSMISRGVPRRMRRPPMIVYPIPVGLFSRRGRSPKIARCRRRTDCAAEEAASTTISGGVSGEPSSLS